MEGWGREMSWIKRVLVREGGREGGREGERQFWYKARCIISPYPLYS